MLSRRGLQVEVPSRLGGGPPTLVLDSWAGQGSQCCFGPGAFDLLRCALGLGAERVRVGDLVVVPVGDHNQGAASPLLPLPPTGGHWTECCNPWLAGAESGVEDCFCSGFDEVTALGQGLLHVGGHRTGGFGNQPGDETRRPSCASRSGGSGGGVRQAVVDDGGDVVGIDNPASLDEAWQEGLNVVVVGFSPAQFRGQRAESTGVDDRWWR